MNIIKGVVVISVKIEMPDYVKKALEVLDGCGFEAFVVGGCVRDGIMKKNANDWDMTTSAEPLQMLDAFKNYRTVPTGIKHGTVTVIIDSHPLEITTYRVDGEYTDNRRPDSVKFTRNIENDLSRRDFTINAMAYSEKDGLVDLFGGFEDIKSRTIRCVGNPDKRFREDALRIMRAIRFSSTLGFDIEERTAESIIKNRHLLKNISPERIRTEFEKLLLGDGAEKILTEFSEVIFEIIPELKATESTSQNCPYHVYNVWRHMVKSIAASPKNKYIRLAMLLHNIEKPSAKTTDENGCDHFKDHAPCSAKTANNILKKLKYDSKTISVVTDLVLHHDDRLYNSPQNVKRHASKLGFEFLYLLNEVSKADILAQNPEKTDRIFLCDKYEALLKKTEEEKFCLKISDLAIDGNDLILLGFKGKEIGRTLDFLLEKVIDNKVKNEKDDLIKLLKECL